MCCHSNHPHRSANAAALAVSRGGTGCEQTLEDVQANQEIWSECCAKLGQAALALSDLKKAQMCGSKCASGLPTHGTTHGTTHAGLLPKEVWRWHALMECVWGQAICLLIDPTRQERALQDDLRDTAMLHLCTSAQWAAHAELPRMVLVAAQQVRVFIHPILLSYSKYIQTD